MTVRRWQRVDTFVVLVLWTVAAAGYVWLAVTSPPVLTGEEASVSMRDVLFTVEQRTQASVWSTNWVAPLWYWVWSHLDPSYTLFSGRQAKAVALAGVAPLVYATLWLRLGCGRASAVLGAALSAALPGVAVFAPVATENGLEALPGLAALLLVTSRRWWPVAPVPAGLAIGTYTAGLAWAVAVLAVMVVRTWQQPRYWWPATAGLASGVLVVVSPLWWWTAGPERIVVGGGRIDDSAGDLALLGRLLSWDGSSYYYFADLPAVGSPVLVGLVVVVAVWAAARRPACWPWLLAAASTVGLWMLGGNLPGTRRVVALVVVAGIVLAVATDLAVRAVPGGKVGRLVALAGCATALLGSVLPGLVGWAAARPALPVDWPAPTGPTIAAGLARLDTDLRAGRITLDDLAAIGDSRSAALVWLLAERRHDTAGLPPGTAIARTAWTYGQDG